MLRLYVPDALSGGTLTLSDDQAHYLRNVMRRAEGDEIALFNGADGEWLGKIETLSKKAAIVRLEKRLRDQAPRRDVRVYASVVKKEAFELMVEKACELGASSFTPLICDRTVVHRVNAERLQAIAVEAAEQSERLDVMTVEPLAKLKDVLDGSIDVIFCQERSGAPTLLAAAQKLKGKPIAVLIGPEGGFTPEEIEFIGKTSHPVSLGPQVLRAETALIAALAGIILT